MQKVFSDAKRIRKLAFKNALEETRTDPNLSYEEAYERWIKIGIQRETAEINFVIDMMNNSEYGTAMQNLAATVASRQQNLKSLTHTDKQSYMITIRPIEGIDVNLFKDKITSLVERSCFIDGCYSFEQKGTTPDSIGQGLHCHLVARMTQKSKGAVLRDIISSFNKWIKEGLISENNIDVRTTHNPKDIVQRYLINYESDDDHKIITKEYDAIFRERTGLASLYPFKRL